MKNTWSGDGVLPQRTATGDVEPPTAEEIVLPQQPMAPGTRTGRDSLPNPASYRATGSGNPPRIAPATLPAPPQESSLEDDWIGGPVAHSTPPPAAVSTQRWRDEVILTTVRMMWRHKLLCVLVVLLSAAAGGMNTFLQPKFYIAKASIYPPTGDNPLGGFGLPGMAGLVGSLGLGGGGSSQFPLYEKVIHSQQLIGSLLQMSLLEAGHKMSLLEYLQIDEPNPLLRMHLATEAMRMKLTYVVDAQTPVATIGCVDFDPKVAALVVNRTQQLLNRFDIATSSNKAREQRLFVEQRMGDAARNLAKAEGNLETFRAENVRIGNAPGLHLELARLQREVEIEQQIYLTLRKEFELARIDEHRTISVVNVLDPAKPPALPSGPSTLKATAVSGFMGGLLVLFFFLTVAIRPRQLLDRLGIVAPRR